MTPRKAFLERNHLPKEEIEPVICQSAKYSYEYAKALGERFPLGEPAICQDPKYAYKYTMNIINRGLGKYLTGTDGRDIERQRYPEAEPTISRNPEFAYKYARYVIGGRWEMGEHSISQDAGYAIDYSRFVLKDRFYLGEETVLECPYVAVNYSLQVIKDRWERLEDKFLEKIRELDNRLSPQQKAGQDPLSEEYRNYYNLLQRICDYARCILRESRWTEAEPYILSSNNINIIYNYSRDSVAERWPEAEPILMQSPYVSYLYAINVIGGRWYEAEHVIKQHFPSNVYYMRDIIKEEWPECSPYVDRSTYNNTLLEIKRKDAGEPSYYAYY